MPPFEACQIKRPRISLSCLVCRRRKVRCGREHPECANCVRIEEKCAYQPTDPNDSAVQAVPVFTEASDRNGNGPGTVNKELTWSHWIPEGADDGIGTLNCERADAAVEKASQPVTSCQPVVPPLDTSKAATYGVGNTMPGVVLCTDYLSLRRGGRRRYVGQAFWGSVAGKENESDNFFDNNQNSNPDLPPSHISAVALFALLRSLPTRTASDALLEIFFYAVWPIAPIVHASTLRADYDQFWEWCANNKTALAPSKLSDDPTFFCLLFAVLYCGASAAPEACWTSGALQGLPKETTVSQLRQAYDTSLSLCQHLEHPTMNSLVSMLLTSPFTPGAHEPMRNVLSVGTIVRLAQLMGLHREGNIGSALGAEERMIRRRVWWYIVRLDVHASISSGLPTCIGSEALGQVNMISDAGEDEDNEAAGHSIANMFSIGCAQAGCLQSRIAACLQSGSNMTEYNLRAHFIAAREVQEMIESLISRVPAQRLPEQGFIPSRLANASPRTHPSLFKDDSPGLPTVFGAWARVMLTIQKIDVAILLQKPLLPPPDSANSRSCKSWSSIAQLCVSYLRVLLLLYQTPAFEPYMWYLRGYHGPLQCVYLTITYLDSFPGSNEVPLARYFVDEAIGHLVSYYQASRYSPGVDTDSQTSSPNVQTPLAIQVLVELHSRLDLTTGSVPSSRNSEATAPQKVPPAPKNPPYLDTGLLAVVAEPEPWSSSLIV